MKNRYVRDLQPNETITEYFLVQSKEVRHRRTGEPYLALILSDRTGQLDAKMWDGVEEVVETFDRDTFVKVKGHIQIYRHRPQMTIQMLRRADESEVRLEDHLPHTSRDIDQMFAELQSAVSQLNNQHLKRLLQAVLDDEEVASRLRRAPAAKSLHHAFIGGLLEHITSLLKLARLAAQNYNFIDLDLLQTGVILHDLGKIYELHYARSFSYTTEGQLLGHINIALRLLNQECAQIPDFPPKLKLLVEHMIVSHHGKYEFGSPKLPQFPEALMLHYLDDLDSKLESMRSSMAWREEEGEWTGYNNALERTLLRKDVFLADGDDGPAPAPRLDRSSSPSRGRPATPLSLFGDRLKSALEGDPENE